LEPFSSTRREVDVAEYPNPEPYRNEHRSATPDPQREAHQEPHHHEQHEAIARWERRWLNAAGLLLVLFLILIAYSLATEGGHIAQRSGRAAPDQLTSLELFANPGVKVTNLGAGRPPEVQVSVVAQSYAFNPSEILLPVGAVATFYLTSRDTQHGFQVEGTNINVQLIPGEISRFTYTFRDAGVYRVSCNEYCGIGHHNMLGTIRVLYPEELAAAQNPAAAQEAGLAIGEGVYTANCAGCHGATGEGVAGAFPPLTDGHVAALAAADRSYLPNLLLYGLQGPINVRGTIYNGQMPAWSALSDEEIAETINYLMASWGNAEAQPELAPYTAEEIAEARSRPRSPQEVHAKRHALTLE
jgi:cytochrome c oxidase subunit 2